MRTFLELFNLAGGKPLSKEEEGGTRRAQIVVRATLASVVFAAIYGLAAGSTDMALAVSNVYKLPMVILLSTVCSLPIGLLAWKLLGAPNRASDLLLGAAAGNFTASLVLAALAPIVALYYHTSGHLGGILAIAAGSIATLLGLWNTFRAVWTRRPADEPAHGLNGTAMSLLRAPALLAPVGLMIVAQLASLVQFIHVASPILPEITVFDGGADELFGG
ncbi:MAG: hypothetical protein Q8P18_05500 [Pseudomonadota bacterium]|nr:hypothetical protein [Pseudomonadota bacterium]